jgi:glycosyltransferase involved in cell wall biosynthesis
VNLLFVVQRYGAEVAGGAEAHCREFAERLARRGHSVEVLTSAAVDYETWEDAYEPGVSVENGVVVRRLSVVRPRATTRFAAVSARVARADATSSSLQHAWMFEQGPVLSGLSEALHERAGFADAAIVFTYLYPTAATSLETLFGRVPLLLHPTAHDEWPARLNIVRTNYDRTDALALSTPEEQRYVELRYRPTAVTEVIGIGFEPPMPMRPEERQAALEAFGLGARPYVACVGRVDPNKGTPSLIAQWKRFRELHPDGPDLVLCGVDMIGIEPCDGLVLTGFVDDTMKWAIMSQSSVIVQPSLQESFGMTVAEGWLAGRPVLVRRECEATAGLVVRSGGGLLYSDFASFDAALGLLLERPELAESLAANGARFVADTLSWDSVLEQYEALIRRVISGSSAQSLHSHEGR